MPRCRKYLIETVVLVVVSLSAGAQGIQIGETCPDIRITNVINYPSDSFSLSSLHKKLVILDFWGTGCTSCIESFPLLDSIQNRFNDEIQLILINHETRDSTLRFFSRRTMISMPHLPIVTGDTKLSNLFPHNSVPHCVWIDSARKVRFITGGYNTTIEHIYKFLKGAPLKLALKKDVFDFDYKTPVIAEGNGRWVKRVLYYSYIMHAIPAQVGGLIRPDRLYINNASISNLFVMAFDEGAKHDFRPGNTVILEVKDPSTFVFPKDINKADTWRARNSYYYEIKIPPFDSASLYNFMQQDLERYFHVTAKVEKRNIKCMVLVKENDLSAIKTKGGREATNIYSASRDSTFYFHDYTLDGVIKKLQAMYEDRLATPFINGTGYVGKVNLEFTNRALRHFKALKTELSRSGLQFVEKEWPVNVLVIHEQGY